MHMIARSKWQPLAVAHSMQGFLLMWFSVWDIIYLYLCLTFQKGAALQEHDCIPDEHYVQTLFSVSLIITSINLKIGTDNHHTDS